MQKQKTMRYQTSDYLDFDTATAHVRKLYREEKYTLSLLIGAGIFFGLRIRDLLSLRWEHRLNEDDKFVFYEKKTNKRRTIKINPSPFHFSTHSLLKTFGRKILELASSQEQGELALIKLSELFNHSNASITRFYLGIKEEEMLSTYDMLEF